MSSSGALVLPAPVSDDQPGVYGPIMDLSEHDCRAQSKSPTGLLRIIVASRRLKRDGKLWPEEEIKQSAGEYLSRWFNMPPAEIFKVRPAVSSFFRILK